MIKNPYLNACIAAAYIAIIVSIMNYTRYLPQIQNILIPITMLSLFVLSAAIMGLLFVYEPAQLFLEGHKKEALSFFMKTVGTFAGIVVLLAITLFSMSVL